MSSKSREHQNLESQAISAPQGEAVNPSAVDSPSLEEIRIRAYEIYMERGGQPGHDWMIGFKRNENRHQQTSKSNSPAAYKTQRRIRCNFKVTTLPLITT